jgi:hypothetical protein
MKLSELLSAEIESVKMEMDPNGHMRVMLIEEELHKVNSFLKGELDRTYDDWVPIWNESVENLETYRTVKIPIPDGGQSIYPAPIARIPADQIIASVYNAIMKPRPVFSIDSYLGATYSIPSAQAPPQPGPNGPEPSPPGMVTTTPSTAEQVAHRMEQGYDFVVRERICMGQKLLRGIKGAVCGSPYWWKVVADPQITTTMSAKSDGAVIDLNDKYEETRLRGDIVKWYLVPFTNGMMPIDADSIDTADWFAERKPMRSDELAKRYATGDLFLVKDDGEASTLCSDTVDQVDQFRARAAVSTEKKMPSAPTQVADTWLTWFYWDVKYIDPNAPPRIDGKKEWKIKRLSLLGDFHLSGGKLMTCFLNPYEHQCRPYELVDQMDEGDCTVGRLKYHQTMFTYAAQAEIKNAFTAVNVGYWHDPNAVDTADFFAAKHVIGTGDHIPGIKEKEWGTYRAGEGFTYSMLDLLKFFLSMSQLDSRENEFTMGGRPPGRTPAATTSQVYAHAEEVKTMLLARLSVKLSRLLRLDAETRRQYQPLGEVLPVWDEEAKATIEIPFRFPVGDVLDNFRMALTAADEVLTQERDPQQIMMRKQALMADGEYVAKVIAAILNLQQPLPASAVELFAKVVKRDQQLMRRLMGQMVTDEESYDLTPELEALIAERNQQLQQQQQQQAQQAQMEQASQTQVGLRGQNAQGASGTGPAPPGAGSGGGPNPGGPPPPQQQPAVPAHAAPPPAPIPGAGPPASVQ